MNTSVTFDVSQQVRTFISTEGTRVRNMRRAAQWRIGAELIVEDGMRLSLTDSEVVSDPSDLPSQEEMLSRLDELVERLHALKEAPIGEPQAAPAILGGRAAAVFFHEVFGHRAEGHRQKDEDEGQERANGRDAMTWDMIGMLGVEDFYEEMLAEGGTMDDVREDIFERVGMRVCNVS